jgi:hypothetical protein
VTDHRHLLVALAAVQSQADWMALVARYTAPGQGIQVIGRHGEEFWPFVDWLHDHNRRTRPRDAGILDLSQYLWTD